MLSAKSKYQVQWRERDAREWARTEDGDGQARTNDPLRAPDRRPNRAACSRDKIGRFS